MKFRVPRLLTERARGFRRQPTTAEAWLWRAIKNRALGGYKFRRQQPINGYIVDFVCLDLMLIVEIDGDIHKSQQDYDAVREKDLSALGFKVIRFHNEDVFANLEGVKEAIFAACETLTPKT
ncbi:MAG: DUF559 domain-containing protein [Anaerolineales bacterium]|nr:DUF559 domain-containing protein [Anaerolineales bacterium]